jgi:hypothetical protein
MWKFPYLPIPVEEMFLYQQDVIVKSENNYKHYKGAEFDIVKNDLPKGSVVIAYSI